jgi:1,2-phenylacetyl-CoA epoxidase PaaB subunit
MTRFELLQLLVAQARANGFEFRKWYMAKLRLPWQTTRQAIETLALERRYYALLFSHEFASSFWKPGERMTFQVASQTFTRRKKDGTIGVVTRKPFTRRSTRDDAWRYHLRELALAEEPLRYMRKYLRVDEELVLDEEDEYSDPVASPQAQGAESFPPEPVKGPSLVRQRLT